MANEGREAIKVNEDALALRQEQYRHWNEVGFLEARARLHRAAEDLEKYGYVITIYIEAADGPLTPTIRNGEIS